MAWEVFDGARPRHNDDPQLSVRQTGKIYINRAADEQYLADVDVASILLNRDLPGIAISAGAVDGGQTYTLHREGEFGADLGIQAPLRDLGVDYASIDGTEHVTLTWDADLGALVADLSALVDDGTDPAASEPIDESPSKGETDTDDDGSDGAPVEEEAVGDVDDQDDADEDATDEDPRDIVEAWVREKVDSGHEYLLEAREIADQVGLTGQRVGAHLRYLRDEADDLEIAHERAAEHDEWDRGRWRLALADAAGDDGLDGQARRFGSDKHVPATDDQDDVDAGQSRDVADETYREVAKSCADIEAFARMFDDMSTVEALRIDRRLGLGLDGARYGGSRNGGGGESA